MKITVDWKLVIAPPSSRVPTLFTDGSSPFSNFVSPLKVRLLLKILSDPELKSNVPLVICVELSTMSIIPPIILAFVK